MEHWARMREREREREGKNCFSARRPPTRIRVVPRVLIESRWSLTRIYTPPPAILRRVLTLSNNHISSLDNHHRIPVTDDGDCIDSTRAACSRFDAKRTRRCRLSADTRARGHYCRRTELHGNLYTLPGSKKKCNLARFLFVQYLNAIC